MIKQILMLVFVMFFMSVSAQEVTGVNYIEKQGNGASRVFTVTVIPQKKIEDMVDEANRMVIKALLFDGVENYNAGRPLVDNPNNPFALSLVDQDKRVYKNYCKETHLEGSDHRTNGHFVVVVNHFNLVRVLNMRKAITTPFSE